MTPQTQLSIGFKPSSANNNSPSERQASAILSFTDSNGKMRHYRVTVEVGYVGGAEQSLAYADSYWEKEIKETLQATLAKVNSFAPKFSLRVRASNPNIFVKIDGASETSSSHSAERQQLFNTLIKGSPCDTPRKAEPAPHPRTEPPQSQSLSEESSTQPSEFNSDHEPITSRSRNTSVSSYSPAASKPQTDPAQSFFQRLSKWIPWWRQSSAPDVTPSKVPHDRSFSSSSSMGDPVEVEMIERKK